MTTETLAADIVDRMPALIQDTANAQQVIANLIRNFVEENYVRKPVHPVGSERNPKVDTRPAKYLWAPGEYINKCLVCGDYFVGDKRSWHCADCSYMSMIGLALR